MKAKRDTKKSRKPKYVLKVIGDNSHFLIRVNYGRSPYRAVSLISTYWLPDQVAHAFRTLADRLDQIPLEKGIKPKKK